MSTLTLGMNGSRDLYLDRFGNIVTKTDEDAMADYLTQRLSTLVGELRFDKTRGVPYMTTVFASGQAGIAPLRSSFFSILANTEHVAGVAYINMAVGENPDELQFEASVATDYGQVVLQR